ncbi:MAG TPA: hypothetical protein VKR06_38650 [Ktedonosporobacter sp.]|nr:hypothetical protein [Ktedonosporobacter sp.]
MESSLQHANMTADTLDRSLAAGHVVESGEEEEPHIHMPGPSLWPFILSAAVVVTVTGLLFVPETPWLTVIGAPFVLVGILGWALQDPNLPAKEQYYPATAADMNTPFKIGQDVVDKDGSWVGTVHGRFSSYLLVDRGGVIITAYYVPKSLIQGEPQNNVVRLAVTESDLATMGAKAIPDDLYEDAGDTQILAPTGVPMFGLGPLSPAETGHYNYGPNYPGINTDASGSYERSYVVPSPQTYVGERRKVYKGNKPASAAS